MRRGPTGTDRERCQLEPTTSSRVGRRDMRTKLYERERTFLNWFHGRQILVKNKLPHSHLESTNLSTKPENQHLFDLTSISCCCSERRV